MSVQLSHPDRLLQQGDYAPVATAAGSRILFLAGQAAVTPTGETTATDLEGQVHLALQNVAAGLRGSGGQPSDVARLTFFVVDWVPRMAEQLLAGTARAQQSEGFTAPLPPITVIGVQALWTPALLVEIEATAVLE